MLLIALFFIRQSFQHGVMNPDSTFCVCQNSPTTNCQDLCHNLIQLKFTQKSIRKSIKLSKSPVLTFLIFGTDEIQPDFNLSTFENRSFNIIAPSQNESIILYPGDANHGIYHRFVDIKIRLKAGFFSFYNLNLVHSEINPFSDKDQCEIGQDYLDLDYNSLNAISEHIYLRPPTNGIKLFCQHIVNKIQFLNDQKIIFGDDSSNFIDFSQVERNGNSTIILTSNDITFTFSQLPKNYDFFPKITFVLRRSSKIFIDEEQFPDEIMELQKYITLQHSDRTVYIQSRPGTTPPKFNLVGTGKELYNDKEIKFFASYCLCENEDCTANCGENEIAKFNEIDSTVVGNPISSITYLIAGTNNLNMPTFDFEHFAKKNLTIIGASQQQHVNITGDATDDFGFYKFSGITIHSNDHFLFHYVNFRKVNFEVHRKSENINNPLLNSTCLNIDFQSLQNLWNKKIKLVPPIHGIGVHTTNIVKEDLVLTILPSNVVSIQNINVSVSNQSSLSIYCDRTINILIENSVSQKLSNFPSIKLFVEGDINTVNFMGNWPKELSDISAKLTVIHNENPLYVQGDFDGANYKFKSPIVDHIGIGPIFFNGVLSNYKDSYCICQGDNCLDLCHGEVPINYTKQSISTTVTNNPTRVIQYIIKNSDSQNYPIFDLADFAYKSFIIKSDSEKRGYVGLLPHKINADSSITYIFKNIKVILLENNKYLFGQLQFETVSFFKYSKKYQNTIINQIGMISDLYSVQSLQNHGLLTPCSSYITINGKISLNKIEISKAIVISLYSADSCVNIDTSNIHETIPTISTLYGSTERLPLRFILSTKLNEIPRIQIDVSHVENGNSYIQFEGSDFTNEYHILTNKITVIHGFNNIHIMTPYEDGMFIGQPPHVSLIGDADYYLNEVKQISFLVPENHTNIKNDCIAYKYSNYIIIIAFFIFIIFIIGFVYYKRNNNRNIDERIPALMMVQMRDREKDKFSSFADDEEMFAYNFAFK